MYQRNQKLHLLSLPLDFCDRCNQHVISNSEVFVNYMSLLQLNALTVPVSHWHNALTICNFPQLLQCSSCQIRCERIDSQANASSILFTELHTSERGLLFWINFDQNIRPLSDVLHLHKSSHLQYYWPLKGPLQLSKRNLSITHVKTNALHSLHLAFRYSIDNADTIFAFVCCCYC